LDLSTAVEGSGVSKLWARSKISGIESLRYKGGNEGDIDAAVLKVALDHHLVSRLTSLVAVDVTPSRPVGEVLNSHEMPTNLPHGWNFEKVFGEDPSSPLIKASLDESLLQQLAGSTKPVTASDVDGVELPQGDAGTVLQLVIGLLFLSSGTMLLLVLRKQKA
jgi:Ca-activated chloride channel family protein